MRGWLCGERSGGTSSANDGLQCDPTHSCGGSLAFKRASQVIDHHTGTAGSKESGIRFSQTTAGARDDDDLPVEAKLSCHLDFWLLCECLLHWICNARTKWCKKYRNNDMKDTGEWQK